MTLLKGVFRYASPLGKRSLQALDRVRQVFGVRKIWFDEKAHIIFVEFAVHGLRNRTWLPY